MDSYVPLPVDGAQALAEIYPAVLARIKAHQKRQHLAFARTHPVVSVAEKDLPEGTLVMHIDSNYKAINKNEPHIMESTVSLHDTPSCIKLAAFYTAR